MEPPEQVQSILTPLWVAVYRPPNRRERSLILAEGRVEQRKAVGGTRVWLLSLKGLKFGAGSRGLPRRDQRVGMRSTSLGVSRQGLAQPLRSAQASRGVSSSDQQVHEVCPHPGVRPLPQAHPQDV